MKPSHHVRLWGNHNGHSRWTLRLLGQRMMELGYVTSVSYEAIRQTLNKRVKTLAE